MSRFRYNLRIAGYVALATIGFLGLMVGLVYCQQLIHDYRWPRVRPKLEAILPTMDPLLAALDRYKRDHGRYPDDVQRLVPSYLREIPHLPSPMPQDVHYNVLKDSHGQAYEIRTYLVGRYNPWPPLTPRFTVLCYRSGEVYPPVIYDDQLVGLVGRWAYYVD